MVGLSYNTPMALKTKLLGTEFGVGDRIRVVQKLTEGEKTREASFEGMVLSIKGRDPGKTFTVRKIADGNIGVERIFPFNLPTIDKIVLVKRGVEGVKRAKLYYTRTKSPTEIDTIYKRAVLKTSTSSAKPKKSSKKQKPKG